MSFSYDLTTDIGQMRLELGDTLKGSGVRPDGCNFSNEELKFWLDREGHVMRAVAAACESLARQWSSSTTVTVGPYSETLSLIQGNWADRAKNLRTLYGNTPDTAAASSFAVPIYRAE